MTTRAEALRIAIERQGLSIIAEGEDGARERWARDALFNGAVRARPLAVVTCSDEASVRAAVAAAAALAVPVSVLAGGHDISGRAVRDDSLLLDLRRMSRVRVDRAAREATVQGGALTRDLLAALPDDLVTATGTITTVGVTGLTLGGGYGRLTSRVGLASDCMTRARVVLADGSAIDASPTANPDVFWALRGGGSGFGVVTSMTLRLHELPRIWSATVLLPLTEAGAALRIAEELLDRHPVELSLFMGFMTAPTGEPVMFIAPLWSGDAAGSEALLRQISFPGASVLQQGWTPYKTTFDPETEKAWPKGRHYHIPTRTLRRLDGEAAAILVEGARCFTSPHSAIVIHDFHGAAIRLPPEATAFTLRENHFVVEVIAAWEAGGPDEGDRHRRWAEALSSDLARLEIPGGYVNLLSPAEEERTRVFYAAAAERLCAIKRRVDPDDLFRFAIGRLKP